MVRSVTRNAIGRAGQGLIYLVLHDETPVLGKMLGGYCTTYERNITAVEAGSKNVP